MKIIISPAKSLDFESKPNTSKFSACNFLEQAKIINKVVKTLSSNELSKLMKISDNLGKLNFERNQEWSLPFSPDNAKQAVYCFTGDVYKGLDVCSIPEVKLDVMQSKLRILSGLYGLLKPLDLIQPYRLEMGTKLAINDFKNLYQFWGSTLVNHLNEEMSEDDVLVDLASNEYSKAIPKKQLQSNLITPVFKELKGDTYKVVSFYAKKARGLMCRYIIMNSINTVDGLKSFDFEGYRFSEQMSSESELVFTR